MNTTERGFVVQRLFFQPNTKPFSGLFTPRSKAFQSGLNNLPRLSQGAGDSVLFASSFNSDTLALQRQKLAEHATGFFVKFDAMDPAKAVDRFFPEIFPKEAAPLRIVDIGTASGRSVRALNQLGHEAFGLDEIPKLTELAKEKYPELRDRIDTGRLPGFDLNQLFHGQLRGKLLDGIVCNDVIPLLPQDDLVESVQQMAQLLKPGGKLLLGFKKLKAHVYTKYGGHLHPIVERGLIELCEKNQLELRAVLERQSIVFDKRPAEYMTLLFEKSQKSRSSLLRFASMLTLL